MAELEPVRQSGSGPAGPDETGFLPDFCQFDVKNDPAGFRPDRTGCKKSVRFQLWSTLQLLTIF
jgi:hypothetical protein